MKLSNLKPYTKEDADKEFAYYQKERGTMSDGRPIKEITYFDKDGEEHRSDGPAIITKHVTTWMDHGQLHRDVIEGPASIHRATISNYGLPRKLIDKETWFMNGEIVGNPEGNKEIWRETKTGKMVLNRRENGDSITPVIYRDNGLSFNDSVSTLTGLISTRLKQMNLSRYLNEYSPYRQPYSSYRTRVWKDEAVVGSYSPRRGNNLPSIIIDRTSLAGTDKEESLSVWVQGRMISRLDGPCLVIKVHRTVLKFWGIDDKITGPSDTPSQEWLDAGGHYET